MPQKSEKVVRLSGNLTLSVMLLLVGAGVGHADEITYDVNQVIGLGSVKGTITTNGDTGIIGPADLVAWTLTLYDGSEFATITSANPDDSVIEHGSEFTATSEQLFYNFSGPPHLFLSWQGPEGYWALGTNTEIGPPPEQQVYVVQLAAVEESGNVAIATAATATPESGTAIYLTLALIVLAGTCKLRHAFVVVGS